MNHLVTIWGSPRATIRDILDTKPGKLALPLAATYGIVHNLHQVMKHGADPSSGSTVLWVLLVNVLFGSLYGIGVFWVFSYLLAGAGRLFGGTPSSRAARAVLAWSAVPYVPLLTVIIPLMLFSGDALIFHSQQDVFRGAAGAGPQLVSLIYPLGRGVMAIWSVVIAVIGLSEAFGISSARSFLVWALAGAVVVSAVIGASVLLAGIGLL